jgi:hypothetical protein
MKTLVPQGVLRSVLSLTTCGYLPCSRQKCQKFARNHSQGYRRNFNSAIHRIDRSQSPLSGYGGPEFVHAANGARTLAVYYSYP